jgi:predicted RNA-binding protein with PUA domain
MTIETADEEKGRKGSYLCSKCGQPKRGHVCTVEKKESSKALRSTAKSDPLNLFEGEYVTNHF